MSMYTVAVISARGDAHFTHLLPFLKRKPLLIDPESLIEGGRLSFAFSHGRSEASYQGIGLETIRTIWYRKPEEITISNLPVPIEYGPYSQTALKGHTALLRTYFRNALWVSDYYAIQRASNKEWQMEVAHRLGFNVPETTITSDPHAAKNFVDKHKTVIVKSMAYMFPSIGNVPHFFYAKRVEHSDSIDLRKLFLAPAIFQQAIEVVADLRITVIGNKVFAAKIVADSREDTPSVRDWRINYTDQGSSFEVYNKLHRDLRDKCRLLVKGMNLMYGAIDLVIDTSGKIWFLEINPNGQWAFVEDDTGQPMGQALADLLEGRSTCPWQCV
jgi:glutathione synthase/RimK-type ligase-like ATP-grasp enzyme